MSTVMHYSLLLAVGHFIKNSTISVQFSHYVCTFRDKLHNTDIRSESGIKGILRYVEEMQMRWYGHVKRMPNRRLPRRLLHWQPNSTRPPGQPRKRWIENIQESMWSTGSTLAEVEHSFRFDDQKHSRGFTSRPSVYLKSSTKYL